MDLHRFLSDGDRARVNEAVVAAEKGTSAEIVPVITDASGSYDRAEDLFGLVLGLVAVAVLWTLYQGVDPAAPWSTAESPAFVYALPHVLLTIMVGFIVGAVLASRVWFIRHLFTARAEMLDCVRRGAQAAFHGLGIRRTTGGTGVLIYVSVFERMVHVVGDGAVADKLSDEDFVAVKDAVLAGFRRGDRVGGLCAGVETAGTLLSGVLPRADDDVDELPNELIVLQQNL
jgi:putative membrane protein